MGKSPAALANACRSLGIGDLEILLYPEAQHELLNETNRAEVMEDMIRWLKGRLCI
jgi:alpha-beta hydrolase superfamily lysophospholipase